MSDVEDTIFANELNELLKDNEIADILLRGKCLTLKGRLNKLKLAREVDCTPKELEAKLLDLRKLTRVAGYYV